MPKNPIEITARGLEDLKEELRYLKDVKRKELSEYMGTALADGDLRESAAYDEARLLQSANETRISDLEELIYRAVVVDFKEGDEPIGRMGARLTIRDAEGTERVFKLVGSVEANVLNGSISIESPLGNALLGRKVGDDVTITTRTGAKTVYRVVAVSVDAES